MHDKKEGYGVFKWQDGRVYKGGWSNGIQHGDGLFFAPSEDEKRGVWHNGELTKWVDADGNEIIEAPRKDSGHV